MEGLQNAAVNCFPHGLPSTAYILRSDEGDPNDSLTKFRSGAAPAKIPRKNNFEKSGAWNGAGGGI